MLDGTGNVVQPDWINLYYKREPLYRDDGSPNPLCTPAEHGICVDLPHGLRYIFGYNMATGTNGPTDPNAPEYWMVFYTCSSNGTHYRTLDAVEACPIGQRITAHATAPNCWDGKNLDSPNHRSHMAYPTRVVTYGRYGCPTTHPYVIPTMSVQIAYTVDANLRTWLLSSDQMHNSVPGSTMHMDYWEAWSPALKATWHRNCVDKRLSCASGAMGDGTYIKGTGELGVTNPNRLVPVPPKP
jgi:hypothetical protein